MPTAQVAGRARRSHAHIILVAKAMMTFPYAAGRRAPSCGRFVTSRSVSEAIVVGQVLVGPADASAGFVLCQVGTLTA